MALRTQVDPYVLIGDSLADLPPPGPPNEGVLFHEEATGECRILVRDAATGLWRWEPFCAGITGPTGATGPAGPTGATGPAAVAPVLKWFGPLIDAAAGAVWLADGTAFSTALPPPAYAFDAAFTARNLTANLLANATGNPVLVELLLNGAPVSSVTFPGGPGILVTPTPVPVSPLDTLTVRATGSGTGTFTVAVTLEMGPP